MAKRQRVFQGGKEYTVTGPTKRSRRLVFIASVKVDGRVGTRKSSPRQTTAEWGADLHNLGLGSRPR